ncbi:MAG: sulfurtransferase TusA family protein [Armatimonadota bacterium]|nr:sulfurtransferase TusA family protein [Armatimonadota bacterium]MCX7778475.1 sulfurtransferase TusA family protein [Armatimonadota bacterium]MDW8026585.1 sulfurtransferase TusA family protein [Armatimonadota bacterium]
MLQREAKIEIEIDCRGLLCPEPVIRARRALEAIEKGKVIVLVDPGAPKENISRMARSMGYDVEVEPTEDGFKVIVKKSG